MKFISTLVFLILVQVVTAQYIITGEVKSISNEPLIGANVVDLNKSIGTISDIDGKFKLELGSIPPSLEISYVGYESKTVDSLFGYADDKLISAGIIRLIPIEMPDCSVVILAEEIDKTQNFSKIESEQLLINPSGNIADDLNTMPGILMHNGTFGTNRLTIRGVGSRNQFGSAKIKGYWNEMPLHNTKGELTFEDANIPFYDQVNIMRGPTPVRFGSGLGGLVQYKTNFNNSDVISASATFGSLVY